MSFIFWRGSRGSSYKLYAESFKGKDHLRRIQAQVVIRRVFQTGPPIKA